MRFTRSVFVIALAISAWAQGGRNQGGRAAQQQQAGAPAAGRGGRGAATAPETGAGAVEFYSFDTSAGAGQPIPDSQPIETHQKITLNGQTLSYTTRAGFLPLRNATTGQTEAHIFYTSYSKDGVSDASTRPIVFFAGGAPGVAATWQEFGGLGPKRMAAKSDTGWRDNTSTLLPQADLVFVNPVGTAFSRPDQPGKGPSFWNAAADVASLAEFVRSYVNHSGRMASPLFLAAEDYGTGRAAGMAAYLNDHQVPVRGVVLLSMTETADALAGDTQYITLLPSLVMTAWHHKKLSAEMNGMSAEQIAGEARKFASREYLHALYRGDRMTAEERTRVIADLSRLTGLSKAFVVNNNLRIALDRFSTELLLDQHHGVSYSDSRVTGFVPLPVAAGRGGGGGFGFGAAPAPIDFNLSALGGPFLTSYESYLRRELTYAGNPDGIYYLTSGGVGPFTAGPGDDASLSNAFARNPNLRLFVGISYYDLNAPFYATEYTLAHLNVSPEVRAHNITVSHLEAGQLAYLDDKALAKLQKDLAGFVEDATRR
jgi:carboxypeptidase C (cathepsin A)